MGRSAEKVGWKLFGTAAAIASGAATRKGVVAVWRRVAGGDPPSNPASRTTRWRDAFGWAAASGVAYGVGRIVAERGAAEVWERATGHLPPGLEDVA